MPYITEHRPAELFMEHAGIAIYHVYEDNVIEQGTRSQRFATHDNGDDGEQHGRNGVFDLHCLPEPPSPPRLDDHPPFVGVEHGREAGFDSYEDWKDSAEYARRRALWDIWHETGETEAIRNTIRHAIDIGLITADGVSAEPDDKCTMPDASATNEAPGGLEAYTLVVISTGHVSHETRAMLDAKPCEEWPCVGGGYSSYGWFFYAHEEDCNVGGDRIPPDLFAIMTWARRHGFTYVLLDCGGNQVDDLEWFDQ